VAQVPLELDGILNAAAISHAIPTNGDRVAPLDRPFPDEKPLRFELIFAPAYVRRRFEENIVGKADAFSPFHEPNLLITSTDGSVEIYATFSKKDRYCSIAAINVPIVSLHGRLIGLLDDLKDLGVSYIEILIPLRDRDSLEVALMAGFVPSAFYPAMRERDGQLHDQVLLSRTLEPLNFRGMIIDPSFKPFIDQYVLQWTQKHLMTLEIYGAR
jgi:hypothetical protein